MSDPSGSASLPSFRQLLRQPVLFLGMGLGSGLASKAPGTWGTLLGTLLFIPLLVFSETWAWWLWILSVLAGSYICAESARQLGVHDHGGIVWDEFAGVWLVLLCLPEQSPWYWLGAFLAFRFFDILKPWPIGWMDRKVTGGFGIMLDDIIAAFYSIIIIWALQTGFF